MKYSKSSPSGTFGLDDYIQFTLSSIPYSINNFNAKIKTFFYGKNKIGTHLKSKT